MLTKEILSGARDKLEDWKGYGQGRELWKDKELLSYLNNALNDWARQTLCFKDSSTEAICKILLLANQHTFDMDERIVAVHKGRLISGWPYVEVKDEIWLSENVFSWETRTGSPLYLLPDSEANKIRIIPYYDSDGYFSGSMTFVSADKSVIMAGANFSTYLSPGDQVVVSGTINNNGTKTIVTAATDNFTVSETVTDESISTIVQKVRDTLWLTVSRLPLNPLLANSDTEQPEINFDYHHKLINGILREAYEKDGAETLNQRAADRHRTLFQSDITLAKKEKYRLRHSSQVLRPHRGTL